MFIFRRKPGKNWDGGATNDVKVVRRIHTLISSILKSPFEGIGKPEPLKANYSGFWSRRITEEHRIIYKVEEDSIQVIQLKGHY